MEKAFLVLLQSIRGGIFSKLNQRPKECELMDSEFSLSRDTSGSRVVSHQVSGPKSFGIPSCLFDIIGAEILLDPGLFN